MTDPGVTASIHKNRATTVPRISNFISSSRFQDVNLVGRLYPDRLATTLSHWALPGGEGAWQQWSFAQVVGQDFTPTSVGEQFGPTWTTHWFKVEFQPPSDWAGRDVRLQWDSGSEAAVWSPEGVLMQGLAAGNYQLRTEYIISRNYAGTGPQTLYVEMAANRLFGGSDQDDTDPPNPNKYFTLNKADIVVKDPLIYKLMVDLEILYNMGDQMKDNPRGYFALYTANQMVNDITAGNDSAASDLADNFFSQKNSDQAHKLAAMGNCHIDTAWLWPYSETKRKIARSYASQLKLIEEYPEHVFVASQAQQWAWCKEFFPELFERVKAQVATGKFLPVGGTWVEMDGNMPSGESFVRQFLYGQRFFQRELNYTCKEFWLPDTFGYSANIPGILKHMGISRFLTQKISWNTVNKFPHHNFLWEGIDGSTVLAHFPPGDNYVMSCQVSEAVYTASNLEDKGRVNSSAYLFGWGDGGGGPTEDMLERRKRLSDVDGIPKMQITTPDQFFSSLEADQRNLCRWVGELFLEMHNGTYTSQAAMKRMVRESEFALRDAEMLLSAAVGQEGLTATGTLLADSLPTLESAWQKVLLNQFHDVLPGSSIELVYGDAVTLYQEALAAAASVRNNALEALFGSEGTTTPVLLNTLPWPRKEVVEVASNSYILAEVGSMGYAELVDVQPDQAVTVAESAGIFTLSNSRLTAKINSTGQIVSLVIPGDHRDVFLKADGTQTYGNNLMIYDDQPLYYDAWDIMDFHLETGRVINTASSGFNVTPVTTVESSSLVAKLQWGVAISEESTFTQEIILEADSPHLTFATSIDWHENRKALKILQDTSLVTRNATFDIQFGTLQRPTHMNTSWDWARYEVCGHKWADLTEGNFGLSVLNSNKYGWMARAGMLSLTLLRSPKNPDDTCDMTSHEIKHALMPHLGTPQEADVMKRAYDFNNPLRQESLPSSTVSSNSSWSLGSVAGEGVILHTIKMAEDGSGDVILRMFECDGATSQATVSLKMAVTAASRCDGMEVAGESFPFSGDASGGISFQVKLTPFQIMALRLQL